MNSNNGNGNGDGNGILKTAGSQARQVSRAVEEQSLNTVVAGFSFAAAIAWMDVVRAIVSQVIPGKNNGLLNSSVVALLTTLLSVVVFMLLQRMSARVVRPAQPVFAVTA